MQNKGFVIFITSCLAIICAFYLSFTVVVHHYDDVAAKMGKKEARAYLDSMANEKVWCGYTLNEARNQQIGLGLDLKGGMNVVLKLNAGDLLKSLSNGSTNPNFLKALKYAEESKEQKNFIDVFLEEYHRLDSQPGALRTLFGNGELRDQITAVTTDEQIAKMIKEKYQSAVDASYNVLQARIDGFGVASANIQRLEGQGRILVELPGVKEPSRVRDLLQRSANLQFWRTYNADEVKGDIGNMIRQLPEISATSNSEVTAAADTSNQVQADSTRAVQDAAQANKKQILIQDLLSFNGVGPMVGQARRANIPAIDSLLQIAYDHHLLRDDLKFLWGAKPITNREGKQTDVFQLYAIKMVNPDKPDLSGDCVTKATADIAGSGNIGSKGPEVSMTMDDEGARIWANLTKQNINRSIAVVLDNKVYSAPNVNNEITGGRSSITGHFTPEEASDLANVLNSGKMSTTVQIEQENVIGPTLGQESINQGFISFGIALILLMIFMCLIYGLVPGLIADAALVINSFFTLGILASFHAMLTLSGIAGLVLTLGMAVDANVLIFERIKEELKAGKGVSRALADGYNNAFSAIFDSNLTTIITGIVLFMSGVGPIKGFAVTLIIGLVASFITAVFLTRIVFEALAKKGKMETITYSTGFSRKILQNPKFDILGSRKIGYLIPSALIVAGIVCIFTIGMNLGIDFSGGRNYVVKFDKQITNTEVRNVLNKPLQEKVLVTAIGTDGKQMRISTNYKINDTNPAKVDEEIIGKMYQALRPLYNDNNLSLEQFKGKIESSQMVSPSMSSDITKDAVIAVVVAMIFMALYILIRFRNIAFSLGAFASVAATTFTIIAAYAVLWKVMPFAMEVDLNFVAAILAIIGYSINDTVVVFDRIRETIGLYPNRDRYSVVNEALNSTLTRTLYTASTTFLVMIIIFIFGGATIRSFTFAILLGIIFGTYATLFIATPIAYVVAKRRMEKRK